MLTYSHSLLIIAMLMYFLLFIIRQATLTRLSIIPDK
jgi:hypothetical protein